MYYRNTVLLLNTLLRRQLARLNLLEPVMYIPGTYQVMPHLILETGIDVAYAAWRINNMADHWSAEKPIDADLILSSPDLK